MLHSIGQANQKAVLSIASIPEHAIAKEVEGITSEKFLKLHALILNLRTFSTIYIAIWVILKIAVHILYLLIYNNIILQPALLPIEIFINTNDLLTQ